MEKEIKSRVERNIKNKEVYVLENISISLHANTSIHYEDNVDFIKFIYHNEFTENTIIYRNLAAYKTTIAQVLIDIQSIENNFKRQTQ